MDLTVYLEKIVRNFSRYHKYSLGSELRAKSREIAGVIIAANSRMEKPPALLELAGALPNLYGGPSSAPSTRSATCRLTWPRLTRDSRIGAFPRPFKSAADASAAATREPATCSTASMVSAVL
jgi:hypothetical protein